MFFNALACNCHELCRVAQTGSPAGPSGIYEMQFCRLLSQGASSPLVFLNLSFSITCVWCARRPNFIINPRRRPIASKGMCLFPLIPCWSEGQKSDLLRFSFGLFPLLIFPPENESSAYGSLKLAKSFQSLFCPMRRTPSVNRFFFSQDAFFSITFKLNLL